jgi:hypothetical protein
MDLPEDELAFLRDLVKVARQRTHAVAWVDRDGSRRQTLLTPADAARLAKLAQRKGVSSAEVLRQAAHIPVAKPARANPPADLSGAAPRADDREGAAGPAAAGDSVRGTSRA